MELHPAGMGLVNQELEDIVTMILARLAGYGLAPRLILRLIVSISLGPDLKEHSIDAALLEQVKVVRILLLL